MAPPNMIDFTDSRGCGHDDHQLRQQVCLPDRDRRERGGGKGTPACERARPIPAGGTGAPRTIAAALWLAKPFVSQLWIRA